MSIDEHIQAVQAANIADSEYNGKKITELPDMVVNSAAELKARFDAAAIEVISPKHNSLVTATAAALSQLQTDLTAQGTGVMQRLTSLNTALSDLDTKIDSVEEACQTADEELEETLNTGLTQLNGKIAQKIGEHDGAQSAHSQLFSAKSDVGHTHAVADVTGAATKSEVISLSETVSEHETRITALEAGGGGGGAEPSGAVKLWEGSAQKGSTITIPGVRGYISLIVVLGDGYGNDNICIYSSFARGTGDCCILGSETRFSNVYVDSATTLRRDNYVARLSLSKWDTSETATINYADCWVETTLNGVTTLSSPAAKKVVAIYGIV